MTHFHLPYTMDILYEFIFPYVLSWVGPWLFLVTYYVSHVLFGDFIIHRRVLPHMYGGSPIILNTYDLVLVMVYGLVGSWVVSWTYRWWPWRFYELYTSHLRVWFLHVNPILLLMKWFITCFPWIAIFLDKAHTTPFSLSFDYWTYSMLRTWHFLIETSTWLTYHCRGVSFWHDEKTVHPYGSLHGF